jgi:hypothetical protein
MFPTHPAVRAADEMANKIAASAHVKHAVLALGPRVVFAVRPVNLKLIACFPLTACKGDSTERTKTNLLVGSPYSGQALLLSGGPNTSPVALLSVSNVL